MFLRDEHGLELAGGTATRPLARVRLSSLSPAPRERWHHRLADIDWVPDLGSQVGSRAWWRGLATCTALCAAAAVLSPGFRPVLGDVPAPLARGADTGRRAAAADLVIPLADTPERSSVELAASLGEGDDLEHLLTRAGVGRDEAKAAATLIGTATPVDGIAPGTAVRLTLGRRPSRLVARPLDRLRIRARLDLALTIARAGKGLVLTRQPIAVDTTPWRLQGLVGRSLYRSLRAAGVPAGAADAYLTAIAARLSTGRDVEAADSYDLVIERSRAATGETRLGALLFAGLDQAGGRTRLVRWTGADDQGDGGVDGDWYDVEGRAERHGEIGMPVAGHVTSRFGPRFHPILGFNRLHKGIDIGAPRGTPVYAVAAARVLSAGWSGGYGNFIRLVHSPALATGYGHLSRVVVRPGQSVERGELIGYVGSTGLSTGPHLHWEVWRGGVPVNPRQLSFDSVERLSGDELRRFRARAASLMAVTPGK